MVVTQFWDQTFAQLDVQMPDFGDPVLRSALEYFGDIENKTIIDLGCGAGATSLFFAHYGANVISLDLSQVAIANLSRFCQENGIDNIKAIQLAAQTIDQLEPVDFIFGSMILHHIEPFQAFARSLRATIKPGGKGFFWENNAQSDLLIWFRQNIVGKLWIPKYGDPDEFPLMPSEVNMLRNYFQVDVEHPELVFFSLVATYILRGSFVKPFEALDRFGYRFPVLRKYSYRQYIKLS
jgi:SAM-dependent methyltransferase